MELCHRIDPYIPVGEVGAAPRPDLDALALLASDDAETVMPDLVQPVGPGAKGADALESRQRRCP
jgi:hypothetical protein